MGREAGGCGQEGVGIAEGLGRHEGERRVQHSRPPGTRQDRCRGRGTQCGRTGSQGEGVGRDEEQQRQQIGGRLSTEFFLGCHRKS